MDLPKPGDTFNQRYRIDGVLGEGGFAVVFDAMDVQTGQLVALKVLKASDDKRYDPGMRARFEREMDVLARLDHPNIVDELAWGESADGLLYVAFERLPGVDLDELLDEVGRMDPRDVVGILRQLLLALDAAHHLGLLHRDIKPQNVRVVDKTPGALRVKLLDFGIARSNDASLPSITRTGQLVGTPRYMSPEQLRDQPLGPTSDIYSLGLMAFELLMGKEALAGNSLLAQVDRMLSGHLLSVPELERANPALLAVIQRMTDKDPASRFARGVDVIARLDEIQMIHAAPLPSATDLTFAPHMDHAAAPELPFAATIAPGAPPAPAIPERTPLPIKAIGLGCLLAAAAALFFALRGDDRSAPAAVKKRVVGITKSQTPEPAPTPPIAKISEPATTPDLGEPAPPLPDHAPRPSPGCERAIPYEKAQLRDVNLYAPRAYRPTIPRPLVILLHDAGRMESAVHRAGDFFDNSGFLDRADLRNFVVIAMRDPSRGWQGDHDVVAVLRATTEMTARELCIDEARVFIVSHGTGGRLASKAACEPWVTGVAMNSFAMRIPDNYGTWCPTSKPAIRLAPLRSRQMQLDGRSECSEHRSHSMDETEARWRKKNNCTGSPVEFARAGGSFCHSWTCETAFTSCRLDGGFPWPGVKPTYGDVRCNDVSPPDFPTAETIWKFFETVPSLEYPD